MSRLLSILVTAFALTAVYSTNTSALTNTTNQNTNLFALNTFEQPKQATQIKKETVKETPKQEEPIKEAQVPQVITYRVEAGDTLSSVAEKHGIAWETIWSKNEALTHQDTLDVGQELVIPNKDEVVTPRETIKPVQAAVSYSTTNNESVPNLAPETSHTSSQTVSRPYQGGANTYDYGWCTWWAKEKRPDIGGFWGNANAWLGSAQAAGYSTGSVPQVGAIAHTYSGPYGHVAFVESVQGNTVTISEMGYGYVPGKLNYRTVPASTFQYIY